MSDRIVSRNPSEYNSKDPSEEDGFSSITFSLQVVDCVSDLKVRFATEAYFELLLIYKDSEIEYSSPSPFLQGVQISEEKRENIIGRLNALLKKAIEFLRNM